MGQEEGFVQSPDPGLTHQYREWQSTRVHTKRKGRGLRQDKEGQPCLKGSRRKGPLLAEKEPRTRAGQKAKSVTEKKAHHGITLQRKTRKNEECTAAKGFGTWKGTPSSPLRCTFYEGMRDTALQWLQE